LPLPPVDRSRAPWHGIAPSERDPVEHMPLSIEDIHYRAPLWHQTFPFVIFWSEKANCTGVAKWFFFQIGLLDEALSYSPWIHDYEMRVYKEKPGYFADCLSAINGGAKLIKFVRNPYDRAFSGYLELCRDQLYIEPHHWAASTRRNILQYLSGFDADLDYAFSFAQYVQWLRVQDPKSLNLHLAKQRMLYEGQIELEPIQVEGGRAVFADLEARFNLLDSTPAESKIYSSEHHHRRRAVDLMAPAAACHLAIPIRRPKEFRLAVPDGLAIAQDVSGDGIRQVFAEDFSSYGYPTHIN
jgi:hypothetical protein